MIRNPAIRLTAFYAISLSFILLNIWVIVKKDSFMAMLLPVVLAILLLAIFAADRILWLVVLLTPLSIPLSMLMPWLTFDMFIPTEPLLVGVLLLFFLKIVSERRIHPALMRHRVTITILIYLFWILVTSLTSTMPVVSLKFLMVKIWFIVGFYILGVQLFENKSNIPKFVWLYTISLLVVIAYTISRHMGYGLTDQQAAHFVMNPFYKDHTSYGAALAMFIPFLAVFSFNRFSQPFAKWTARGVLAVLIIAFILSYTRAAWLSLSVAIFVWVMIRLQIRFRTLVITTLSILALVLVFQRQILAYLERNDEESSSDLIEHFSSISNITSDASNLERINRWHCAIRMFRDRPVFGFGPGTYMFKYAPYQLTRDRTIISTNAGDAGNAHSEYLGPLAESGLFGMISMLLLVITVMYTAFKTYKRLKDPHHKAWLVGAIIGLITYYGHGLMNNFLDTDKASVPFWGFTAMIVALDLFSRENLKKSEPFKSDHNEEAIRN
ncbi:MAG TPA: O-antigen ligase family protein [Prolixibacteraceae bacterium]|nr:O-antigen ligase family protein [Prolixibacteraceae bacterium]HOS00750.1 O-antigen ligase family protein [Prolixibacteraceae bacterium]HPL44903.1 O-antigen ligase family protein [Prolixibacteraceae bacterium]HQJ85650.1 O-antigen ligase family protein [Prolixibacteraceae bacterium]